MSKNTRNRILLTAIAALLLLAVTVGGTMAWLQASTDPVTNTFTPTTLTVGIDENVPAGKTAEMIPGATIAKDPFVTYTTDVAAYLFVKVTKSSNYDTYLENYSVDSSWTLLNSTATEAVYYKTVDADTSSEDMAVLNPESVKVKTGVTKDLMDALIKANGENNPELSFEAYIIQSQNLVAADGTTAVNDAAGAWAILNP